MTLVRGIGWGNRRLRRPDDQANYEHAIAEAKDLIQRGLLPSSSEQFRLRRARQKLFPLRNGCWRKKTVTLPEV